jgi:addiction module HigA family antidote
VLLDDFMRPLNMTAGDLARYAMVPLVDAVRVLRGNAPINSHWSAVLASLFDTTEDYWLNMQAAWECQLDRGDA